jgi:hypothetical protein
MLLPQGLTVPLSTLNHLFSTSPLLLVPSDVLDDASHTPREFLAFQGPDFAQARVTDVGPGEHEIAGKQGKPPLTESALEFPHCWTHHRQFLFTE